MSGGKTHKVFIIADENFHTIGRDGLQNLACHILQREVGSMCQVCSTEGIDLSLGRAITKDTKSKTH